MPQMAMVTPNGLWPTATSGDVAPDNPPPQIQKNVPIVVIPICPATVTVEYEQYPTGVVILNENPLPNNAIPIHINYRKVPGPSVDVPLSNNQGWPYGEVVLWD